MIALRRSRTELDRIGLRLGRYCLWPYPRLYWPVGKWRDRVRHFGNCDLWVGGYPRSGNTFLWKWMERAFPEKQIGGHLHVPPSIIRQIQQGRHGILTLRSPRDAVVSWSLYTHQSLRDCLHYYIDFHRVLLPYRKKMIIAPFENITMEPAHVIENFGQRVGLQTCLCEVDRNDICEIFRSIEEDWRNGDGSLDEMKVARPSEQRRAAAHTLRLELDRSRSIRPVLLHAEKLYRKFHAASRPAKWIRRSQVLSWNWLGISRRFAT